MAAWLHGFCARYLNWCCVDISMSSLMEMSLFWVWGERTSGSLKCVGRMLCVCGNGQWGSAWLHTWGRVHVWAYNRVAQFVIFTDSRKKKILEYLILWKFLNSFLHIHSRNTMIVNFWVFTVCQGLAKQAPYMYYIISSPGQVDVAITMMMNLILWVVTEALRGWVLGMPRSMRGSHSQISGDVLV